MAVEDAAVWSTLCESIWCAVTVGSCAAWLTDVDASVIEVGVGISPLMTMGTSGDIPNAPGCVVVAWAPSNARCESIGFPCSSCAFDWYGTRGRRIVSSLEKVLCSAFVSTSSNENEPCGGEPGVKELSYVLVDVGVVPSDSDVIVE